MFPQPWGYRVILPRAIKTYIGDVKKSFRASRGKDINVQDVDVGDVLDSLSR
ncbi:putative transposase [Saccharolobus shibatae]|uniref:Putative transposase n=2 Tax=Saccharolobus shibatae TaxID=2286 RepID=A0A8F5BV68_9CREN|nr:putative transposase [Saccharolobus shibatae]